MHILAAILAALGAIGVVLWRLRAAADAAKGIVEAANDAHGMMRRWGWRRKLAKDSLELIQDPREAAVAMMVALAQSDGAMTERERSAILAELISRVGATEKQAEEFLAHGRWLTREVKDPDTCIARLVPLIKRQCSPEQVRDVAEMLAKVANADGTPGEIEAQSLAKAVRALKV